MSKKKDLTRKVLCGLLAASTIGIGGVAFAEGDVVSDYQSVCASKNLENFPDSLTYVGSDNTFRFTREDPASYCYLATGGGHINFGLEGLPAKSIVVTSDGAYAGVIQHSDSVVNVFADNYSQTSEGYGIYLWSGGTLNANLTDKFYSKTAKDGLVVMSDNYGTKTSHATIKAKEVDIETTATSPESEAMVGAVWVQSNTEEATAPDDASSLTINADTVKLTAKNTSAIVAYSNGQVNITGNTTIDGGGPSGTVIETRGNSTVNINTDGQHTTVLKGNIIFGTPYVETDRVTDGHLINSNVNINLTGADSYWTGRAYQGIGNGNQSVELTQSEFYGNVTGFNLTIADDAAWNMTYSSFVNNATLKNGGTINVGTDVTKFNADTVTMDGGKIDAKGGTTTINKLKSTGDSILNLENANLNVKAVDGSASFKKITTSGTGSLVVNGDVTAADIDAQGTSTTEGATGIIIDKNVTVNANKLTATGGITANSVEVSGTGSLNAGGNVLAKNMIYSSGKTDSKVANLNVTNKLDVTAGKLTTTGTLDAKEINVTGGSLDAANVNALDSLNVKATGSIKVAGNVSANDITFSAATDNAVGSISDPVANLKVSAGTVTTTGDVDTYTIDVNGGSLNVGGDVETFAVEDGLTVSGGSLNATGSVTAGDVNVTGGELTAKGVVNATDFTASDKGSATLSGGATISNLTAAGNSTITLTGDSAKAYVINGTLSTADSGKVILSGGTINDDKLASKLNGTLELKDSGIISTKSDQIYTNAASDTAKDSGAVANTNITYTGGTLNLTDAQYTLGYVSSAKSALKEQTADSTTQLVMSGDLVNTNTGDVNKIDIDSVVDYASDVTLDKVEAVTEKNLLVGTVTTDSATADGLTTNKSVKEGFSVSSLAIEADDSVDTYGVIITNDKTVTLGGSDGGSVIKVVDSNSGDEVTGKDIKVVAGTSNTVGTDTTSKSGTLTIGNGMGTSDTTYTFNGEVVLNSDSALNVNGNTSITNSVTANGSTVNVNSGAKLSTDKLTLNAGTVAVADSGNLTVATMNVEDDSTVTGSASVTDTLTIEDDKVLNVGTSNKAGKLTVKNLNGGIVFLDPAWKTDGTDTIQDASGLAVENTAVASTLVAGQNSKIAIGTTDLSDADTVFNKTGLTWGEDGVTSGVYVASTADVSNGAIVADGSLENYTEGAKTSGTVEFADNSLLMVDGDSTKSTAAITGVTSVTVDDSSKLYIDNAVKNTTYHILAGDGISSDTAAWADDNVISSTSLLKFTGTSSSGAYDVTSSVKSLKEAFGGAVVGPNTYDAALQDDSNNALSNFAFAATDSKINSTKDAQITALNSQETMTEQAGVSHSTYAVSNLLTDAAVDHMSLAGEKTHDKDVWAKFIHTKEKISNLDVANIGATYDSQYNGFVIGTDFYNKGKGTVGAALTYVDGSISGSNVASSTRNNAKYYGVSIYGGIHNGDSAVIGDITYLHGSHDISQSNSGYKLTGDAKSDAFGFGVRAEKSFKAGVGKVVPYAGLRYMHLGTGNYTNSIGMSYDTDDMNLWMLPVGVKYSANIKTGNCTFRPVAELGYVWNMGGRRGTQNVGWNSGKDSFSFNVADRGSWIGRLGFEVEQKNVTYSLGFEYQKGSTVKSNRWMASLNWKF